MRHFAQKRRAMEREKMSRETNWVAEAPAINHNACVEIENTTPVNTAVDNSELCSSTLRSLNVLILAHLVTLSALEGM